MPPRVDFPEILEASQACNEIALSYLPWIRKKKGKKEVNKERKKEKDGANERDKHREKLRASNIQK